MRQRSVGSDQNLTTVSLWRNFCLCFVSCFLQSDLARVVQSALFVSGINTLIQTVLGSRLPAVMGNSFYFLPVILSIVNSPRIMDIGEPHEVVTTTVVPSPVLCIVSFSSLICYHACAY
jgi:xanthine/uracil permease